MTDFLKLHRSHFDIREFLKSAAAEDIGAGDHTSLSTIPSTARGRMKLLVKEDGIIAGVEAALHVLKFFCKAPKIQVHIKDGTRVVRGDVVFVVEANSRQLLTAERLLLNIMQRMSGIATRTAHLQSLCDGTKARVTDTRKTTPGFRFFEKWAVVIGGGANHRYGLFDMILIKDNHIDFAGGIVQAIDAANAYLRKKKLRLPVEVETRTIDDVKKVLAHGGVQRIMLDNYSPSETRQAVKLIKGRYEVEASGGITGANIAHYARAGVDFISVGELTHHISSLDMSLKVV